MIWLGMFSGLKTELKVIQSNQNIRCDIIVLILNSFFIVRASALALTMITHSQKCSE